MPDVRQRLPFPLLVRVGTRRRPLRIFTRTATTEKMLEPYCSYAITHHGITINLSDEGAKDPAELRPTTKGNSGSNAEGAHGDERNATMQQSTCQAMKQYVHRRGGLGSKGNRRGRMRRTMGTKRATTATTRRRGAPSAPPSPFPRRRRWRSPDLFISSSRGEGRMDTDPEGDKEGEGGVGVNEGIGNTETRVRRMPRGPSSPFPQRRQETKEPWPSPLLCL